MVSFINFIYIYLNLSRKKDRTNDWKRKIEMVQNDPTNELIFFLHKDKYSPSFEFVENILKAFVNWASLIKIANILDPTLITVVLEIYKATEDFVSQISKFTEKALPPMTNEEEKNWLKRPLSPLCSLFLWRRCRRR